MGGETLFAIVLIGLLIAGIIWRHLSTKSWAGASTNSANRIANSSYAAQSDTSVHASSPTPVGKTRHHYLAEILTVSLDIWEIERKLAKFELTFAAFVQDLHRKNIKVGEGEMYTDEDAPLNIAGHVAYRLLGVKPPFRYKSHENYTEYTVLNKAFGFDRNDSTLIIQANDGDVPIFRGRRPTARVLELCENVRRIDTAPLRVRRLPKRWRNTYGQRESNSETDIKRWEETDTVSSAYTSFEVGSHPTDIIFDGKDIWTANSYSRSVSKISLEGKEETFEVDNGPNCLTYDSGFIWIGHSSSGTLTKLAKDGKRITTVHTGHSINALLFDGTNIWVGNGTDRLTKIGRDGQELGNYNIHGRADCLVFDGSSIWAADQNQNIVRKIDLVGNILGKYRVGRGPRALAFDGTYIWVANGWDDTVSKLSLTGKTMSLFRTGEGPISLLYDGENIWVSNYAEHSLLRMTSDGVILDVLHIAEHPEDLTFDGESIWVCHRVGDIVSKISPKLFESESSDNSVPLQHEAIDNCHDLTHVSISCEDTQSDDPVLEENQSISLSDPIEKPAHDIEQIALSVDHVLMNQVLDELKQLIDWDDTIGNWADKLYEMSCTLGSDLTDTVSSLTEGVVYDLCDPLIQVLESSDPEIDYAALFTVVAQGLGQEESEFSWDTWDVWAEMLGATDEWQENSINIDQIVGLTLWKEVSERDSAEKKIAGRSEVRWTPKFGQVAKRVRWTPKFGQVAKRDSRS